MLYVFVVTFLIFIFVENRCYEAGRRCITYGGAAEVGAVGEHWNCPMGYSGT